MPKKAFTKIQVQGCVSVCVCVARSRKKAFHSQYDSAPVLKPFARKLLISDRSLGASWLADARFNLSL